MKSLKEIANEAQENPRLALFLHGFAIGMNHAVGLMENKIPQNIPSASIAYEHWLEAKDDETFN